MALERVRTLSAEESAQICAALETILAEFENRVFSFQQSDEDIHTAVERRLGEIVGSLAGKLHNGRSRNDQVRDLTSVCGYWTTCRYWMSN